MRLFLNLWFDRGFWYFVKVQFMYGFSFFINIMIKIELFNSNIKRLIWIQVIKQDKNVFCIFICKVYDYIIGYLNLNMMF